MILRVHAPLFRDLAAFFFFPLGGRHQMLLHVFACLPRRCRLLFSTVKHTLPMLVLLLLRSCLSLSLSISLSVACLSLSCHVTSRHTTMLYFPTEACSE